MDADAAALVDEMAKPENPLRTIARLLRACPPGTESMTRDRLNRPEPLRARIVLIASAVLFASLGSTPAFAILPALPPPCAFAIIDILSVDSLAANVQAVSNGEEARRSANCSSEALSRKGDEAIPALISLMDSQNTEVQFLALSAVCGEGHRGDSAVPYILERMRRFDPAFEQSAYRTLACMGEGARPAIPLLLAKSLQTIPGAPAQEADAAIETLGRLATVDPDTIIPRITKLLEVPSATAAAAAALEKIGDSASIAVSALRVRLEAAIKERHDAEVASLISALTRLGDAPDDVVYFSSLLERRVYSLLAVKALGRIGEQAIPALPLMIRAFADPNIDQADRYAYIDALISVDPDSEAVRRILLREATNGDGYLSGMRAASRLSEIDPLPADFAPMLVKGIEGLDDNDAVAHMLRKALDHTHTVLQPRPSPPASSPVNAPPYVARALKALAKQPRAITLRDAAARLRLDPRDYRQDGMFSMTLKRPHDKRHAPVIARVSVTAVMPAPAYASSSGMIQNITIDLLKHYCVAAASIPDDASAEPDPSAIYVIAPRNGDTFKFKGIPSKDRLGSFDNTLYLGAECGSHVAISKMFESDYWARKCPFVYDGTLITERLIPALESQIGPDFERYDLYSPQTREVGRGIQLVFSRPEDPAETLPSGALALRVWIDRCTRQIEKAWEY